MVKIDSRLHLRNFLRGVEASVVIIVAIILYDLLKEYEIKRLRNTFIPEEYHKLITKFLYFCSIFIAEILIVYILILTFGVEF
jgi:hypothetical protein